MSKQLTRAPANIFRDLGFSEWEAQNLEIRSKLMIELTRFIEDGQLTQARAAKMFGVTQPRISDLVRGRIERFSVDGLIEILGKAGIEVRVDVGSRRRAA